MSRNGQIGRKVYANEHDSEEYIFTPDTPAMHFWLPICPNCGCIVFCKSFTRPYLPLLLHLRRWHPRGVLWRLDVDQLLIINASRIPRRLRFRPSVP